MKLERYDKKLKVNKNRDLSCIQNWRSHIIQMKKIK